MFFFQLPLSEQVVPYDEWNYIRELWKQWSPGFDGAAEIDRFIQSATPEGHLAAILGYYRATFQPELNAPEFAEWNDASTDGPPQPTLYLHGKNDGALAQIWPMGSRQNLLKDQRLSSLTTWATSSTWKIRRS